MKWYVHLIDTHDSCQSAAGATKCSERHVRDASRRMIYPVYPNVNICTSSTYLWSPGLQILQVLRCYCCYVIAVMCCYRIITDETALLSYFACGQASSLFVTHFRRDSTFLGWQAARKSINTKLDRCRIDPGCKRGSAALVHRYAFLLKHTFSVKFGTTLEQLQFFWPISSLDFLFATCKQSFDRPVMIVLYSFVGFMHLTI